MTRRKKCTPVTREQFERAKAVLVPLERQADLENRAAWFEELCRDDEISRDYEPRPEFEAEENKDG